MRLLFFYFLLVSSVEAFVMQKSFFQVDPNRSEKGGIQVKTHWNPSQSIALHIHEFPGALALGSLSFEDVHGVTGKALRQWTDNLLGAFKLPLNFSLDLNGNAQSTPYPCETQENGAADGINNIVFSSKMDPDCSSSIARGEGTVGLTKILYQRSTGQILEADIQFNDVDYEFVVDSEAELPLNSRRISFPGVLVHELGHFLGLDHAHLRSSSMLYSVDEGLETTERDDQAGVLSLYGAQKVDLEAPDIIPLIGSLRDADGSALFGASIILLDAQTLEPMSHFLSDLNGHFNSCSSLQEGRYIALVDRFRPHTRSVRIHSYYAGDADQDPERSLGGGCFNPACKLMDALPGPQLQGTSLNSSFRRAKIISLNTDSKSSYLNLIYERPVQRSEPEARILEEGAVQTLEFENVYEFKASRQRELALEGAESLSTQNFQFSMEGRQNFAIHFASLSLNSRVRLRIEGFDNDFLENHCQYRAAQPDKGQDPFLKCDLGQASWEEIQFRVQAESLPCQSVPGNGGRFMCADVQSHALEHFLIALSDPAEEHFTTVAFGSPHLELPHNWKLMPACGVSSYNNIPTEPQGAWCGRISKNISSENKEKIAFSWVFSLLCGALLGFFVKFFFKGFRILKKSHPF